MAEEKPAASIYHEPDESKDTMKNIIYKAVSKHGHKEIMEDKAFEMIVAMIYRRIRKALFDAESKPQQDNTSKEPRSWGKILLTGLTIITSILFIISFFGGNGSSIQNTFKRNGGTKGGTGLQNSIFEGPFEYKPADRIDLENYFGREDIILRFEDQIKKYLRMVKAVQMKRITKREMDNVSAFTRTNFALFGPPGTGKTMFVQNMAVRINNYLKEEALKEKDVAKYNKLKSSPPELKKTLAVMPSKVFYCEVSGGIINNKYYGESESNINKLFIAAKSIAQKNDSAVFIFFDEGDTFFSKRKNDPENSTSAVGNVKAELLQRIGQRPSGDYVPVFVFCATNLFENFDDAFKRRFGIQATLEPPGTEERKNFIKFVFRMFDINDKEVEMIVELTKGRAHSFIPKQAQQFYVEDEITCQITGFKLKEFIISLEMGKDNRDLI